MSKQGLILLNLGSPDSTEVNDVRNYLREFLMDERVLDAPKLIRWLIVHCFILPKRPRQSAEAYASIWKPEGSPLVPYIARTTSRPCHGGRRAHSKDRRLPWRLARERLDYH